jgi:hypothetical protein
MSDPKIDLRNVHVRFHDGTAYEALRELCQVCGVENVRAAIDELVQLDEKYADIVHYVLTQDFVSAVELQRGFRITWMRASRYIEELIHSGFISNERDNFGRHLVLKPGVKREIAPPKLPEASSENYERFVKGELPPSVYGENK